MKHYALLAVITASLPVGAPAQFVSAIVTDRGVFRPPFRFTA